MSDKERALEFPCRSCGAQLGFDAAAAALKCEHCNYTEAIPASPELVEEHAFEHYKEELGWGTDRKEFDCKQCGAQTQVDPHITAFSCAFCGSNQVVPNEEVRALHKPESLLPFRVPRDEVVQLFKTWVAGLWFRPNALKRQARADGLKGVYLPFWTYDAMTHSWWTAQAGYHYYEKDSEGNRVQRTRWESASGTHDEFFDDVLVQASPSVDAGLVQSLEPWPTKSLQPYQPQYLAGKLAENYRNDMPECWDTARSRIDSAIHSACSRAVPGDTHRFLNVKTSYLNRTYKLCLLPIWLATYRYSNKPYTYLVNGQSGEVTGDAPWSWVKISFAVLTVAAIIGGIVYAQNV